MKTGSGQQAADISKRKRKRKSIFCFSITALLLALSHSAEAQQPKIPRIGYMSLQSRASESARVEGFRQGLRDLGYIEGKSILIEYPSITTRGERVG